MNAPSVCEPVLPGIMFTNVLIDVGNTLIVEPLVEMLMPLAPTRLEVAGTEKLSVWLPALTELPIVIAPPAVTKLAVPLVYVVPPPAMATPPPPPPPDVPLMVTVAPVAFVACTKVMLLPPTKTSWFVIMPVLLLVLPKVLTPAENAGALMVTLEPFVDKLTMPPPTTLEVCGTDRLNV